MEMAGGVVGAVRQCPSIQRQERISAPIATTVGAEGRTAQRFIGTAPSADEEGERFCEWQGYTSRFP